ncbi:MAG: GntR family transcriptional regulator [Frankiaceae bacterium]|nr:GntR family transcriptional regulator [Frankiaceae bacterium]
MGESELPEIDYRSETPPYAQVADWMRDQIRAGVWKPRQAVPSEKWLQDSFGVARETARRAVALLREEGLVYTVQARGSYVRPPGTDKAGRPLPPGHDCDTVPTIWGLRTNDLVFGDGGDSGYYTRR